MSAPSVRGLEIFRLAGKGGNFYGLAEDCHQWAKTESNRYRMKLTRLGEKLPGSSLPMVMKPQLCSECTNAMRHYIASNILPVTSWTIDDATARLPNTRSCTELVKIELDPRLDEKNPGLVYFDSSAMQLMPPLQTKRKRILGAKEGSRGGGGGGVRGMERLKEKTFFEL